MTKRANTLTTSALLQLAAWYIYEETNLNGAHSDIADSLINRKQHYGFPMSAFRRANKILDMLFVGKDGRRETFGKQYSESIDKFAINNVFKNRDHRVTALLMAAAVAKDRIPKKVKRANTAPSTKVNLK